MNNYIKPAANVIELAVIESLSYRDQRTRSYRVNGYTREIKTNLYTAQSVSSVQFKKSEA